MELNYKTATQLAETYYNKTEVDNLITFDPTVVYTKTEVNSILNSNRSTIEDRGQLFLAYSSTNQINEAYYDKAETDYLLANKVSTTGDASISGNLDVGSGSSSRIRNHASVSGYTGYSELNTASPWDMWINLETTYPNGGWMHFKINNDDYMQLSSSDNKVNIYTDTTTSGNLDVGPSQAVTSIKAYVNHAGHQGNVELKALWNSQGYSNFKTTNPDGLLLFATKDDLYLFCVLNIIYLLQTNNKCIRWQT